MKHPTVLVTGAGAGVGQGILRSLRMSSRNLKIITADPDARAAGHWIGDKGYIIPFANNISYGETIESIILKEKVDVIFVGTDVELTYFAKNKTYLESLGTKTVVCSPDLVKIADDKWLTAQFLKQNGLAYPRSACATDLSACVVLAQECGYPLFSKPRHGARSIGTKIIHNLTELMAISAPTTDMIVQEMLPDIDGEFTAGCIGTKGSISGVVILKRDLRDGNTYRAYHDGVNKFEREIVEIASKLDIDGPCNLQFRIKNGVPVVFEINARFSGTTPIRAIFGFNEVEAILNNILDGIPIIQPILRAGAVFRTWSDIFVNKLELSQFTTELELNNPCTESIPFIIGK